MNTQLYIGIMSGTSMDGADAVLIRMQGNQWQGALAHAFTPYSDDLRQELLNLQNIGDNELHRSNILSQTLSRLYAQTVHTLLSEQNLPARSQIAAAEVADGKNAGQFRQQGQVGKLDAVTVFGGVADGLPVAADGGNGFGGQVLF